MGSKGDQSDFGHTSPYSVLIWLITHRQPANNAKETKLDQQKWNRAVERSGRSNSKAFRTSLKQWPR